MEIIETNKVNGDLRQSSEYGRYMEKIGWKVKKLKCGQIFFRTLGPIKIAKFQRFKTPCDMNEVEQELKNERVVMCKIEPANGEKDYFRRWGYNQDGWPMLATRTLQVNLVPAELEILSQFSKETRYTIRKKCIYENQYKINEFENFYSIWKKSSRRKGIWQPSNTEFQAMVQSFGNKCFCVTIGDLAGATIFIYKKTAFYYFAGATFEGNKLDLPYMVVWRAMREAKKRGCTLWDFDGIFDCRWPNRDWIGFSRFKKGFGGREVEYLGSFVKWRWPF